MKNIFVFFLKIIVFIYLFIWCVCMCVRVHQCHKLCGGQKISFGANSFLSTLWNPILEPHIIRPASKASTPWTILPPGLLPLYVISFHTTLCMDIWQRPFWDSVCPLKTPSYNAPLFVSFFFSLSKHKLKKRRWVFPYSWCSGFPPGIWCPMKFLLLEIFQLMDSFRFSSPKKAFLSFLLREATYTSYRILVWWVSLSVL